MDEEIIFSLANIADANSQQQAKTLNYFEELKNSESGWQLCVQALVNKTYASEEVQFFCLQVIEHLVKTRYINVLEEHKVILRDFLCSWSRSQVIQPKAFLKNKVAQIIALMFVQEYPMKWPNFFTDLLSSVDTRPETVDQYLRVLLAIDIEIADRDISRTNQELHRNNLIKDALREKMITSLVDSWFNILTTFEKQSPTVTCLCLQVIGKYILWIDINLVANDKFVPVLVNELSDVNLREASAECIHDIICKGMDPVLKTKLIESFSSVLSNVGIWQALQDDSDPEYVAKLGKILNAMGCNLIEGHAKLTKSNDYKGEICQAVYHAIETKIPLVLKFLGHDYDDVSSSVLEFLRDYLHLLKSDPTLTPDQSKYFQMTLEGITKKVRYDSEYDFSSEGEDEAQFMEFRKELKVIFENLTQINKTIVIEHVRNIVTIAIQNWRTLPFEDVEVAILLLYYLGEAIPTGGSSLFNLDPEKSSPVQVLLMLVMNSDVHLHTHPAVIIQYFETIVRYEKFFVCHTDYIYPVLAIFLKENGLFHPDKRVRSRCAYLFCRFIKCVRNHISIQLTTDIIQAIQPLLALVPPSKGNEAIMSPDDQLYLFEVVGVVIISGEHSVEKAELMKKVVGPLLGSCRILTEKLAVEKDPEAAQQTTDLLIQAISVTGRLSKAFSNQQTMKLFGCVPVFLEALEVFLRCIDASCGEQQLALQSCVRQYLHRMVVCLEEELLPYIPIASQALLKNCDCKSIQEYIPLINQIIAKFKLSWIFQKEVVPFLKQMFTPMVQSIFKTLAEPIESNDLIALRERQMLQRQYFHFIATIVTNNVTDVFAAEENSPVLQQVMMTVIQGSVDFPDPVAQRACFSILRKFVDMWGGPNHPEGFIDFMYKNIVPACFMAPCKSHFDINDAQTILALYEIASCLKCVFDKRKEECIVYLETHYLPTLDLPAASIQGFLQAIQANIKEFRIFLKAFFLFQKAKVQT